MQATKQDVQIINGIGYPYVTKNGNPARIICENAVRKKLPCFILELDGDCEVHYTLTNDHKMCNWHTEPYIKPYVKPSIFEGMKPGTVVFVRFPGGSGWMPICFCKEVGIKVLTSSGHSYDKSYFEFRLDNPYLAEPEVPAEKPWIEWKGGEMPVPEGTKVDVKFRNGVVEYSISAGLFGTGVRYAAVNWWNNSRYYDIVAYRLA